MTTPETRNAELILIIGYNGTGKTTFSKKLIIDQLKKGNRALIVTPDDIEWSSLEFVHDRFPQRIAWYKGARKIIYFPGLLPIIADNYRNGWLLFDDCRAYLGSTTEQDLHNLLIRRRQKGIDIMAVAHGFTDIPPKFFTFASKIVLFRTIDNIERRKNVIKDFDMVKHYQAQINAESDKNPHTYKIIEL